MRLARLKDALAVLGTVGALLGSTAGFAWSALTRVTTDDELSGAVTDHDLSAQAHGKLRERIEQLERSTRAQDQAHAALARQTIELWRWQVGYAAADREDDRRLRAAAASYYREIFDRMIREGSDPEHAFRGALNERWTERPRLH